MIGIIFHNCSTGRFLVSQFSCIYKAASICILDSRSKNSLVAQPPRERNQADSAHTTRAPALPFPARGGEPGLWSYSTDRHSLASHGEGRKAGGWSKGRRVSRPVPGADQATKTCPVGWRVPSGICRVARPRGRGPPVYAPPLSGRSVRSRGRRCSSFRGEEKPKQQPVIPSPPPGRARKAPPISPYLPPPPPTSPSPLLFPSFPSLHSLPPFPPHFSLTSSPHPPSLPLRHSSLPLLHPCSGPEAHELGGLPLRERQTRPCRRRRPGRSSSLRLSRKPAAEAAKAAEAAAVAACFGL